MYILNLKCFNVKWISIINICFIGFMDYMKIVAFLVFDFKEKYT